MAVTQCQQGNVGQDHSMVRGLRAQSIAHEDVFVYQVQN
jgi:hypothetical protein